jgi:hypothetical protein
VAGKYGWEKQTVGEHRETNQINKLIGEKKNVSHAQHKADRPRRHHLIPSTDRVRSNQIEQPSETQQKSLNANTKNKISARTHARTYEHTHAQVLIPLFP